MARPTNWCARLVLGGAVVSVVSGCSYDFDSLVGPSVDAEVTDSYLPVRDTAAAIEDTSRVQRDSRVDPDTSTAPDSTSSNKDVGVDSARPDTAVDVARPESAVVEAGGDVSRDVDVAVCPATSCTDSGQRCWSGCDDVHTRCLNGCGLSTTCRRRCDSDSGSCQSSCIDACKSCQISYGCSQSCTLSG